MVDSSLSRAASGADAPRLCLYFALYHEAVAANLLERLALHGALCDAAGEDALAEAADYAVRSVRLAARRPSRPRGLRRETRPQLLFLTTSAGSAAAPHEECAVRCLSALLCLPHLSSI